jgi:putative transposase
MSHRYRLYPDSDQVATLQRHCADARFVWNLALEQANLYRSDHGPTPNRAERQHQLAEARQSTWLGEGSSSVQQVALRDFDQAMRNWWGATHQRPTWRVKGKHEGFCVRDVVVKKLNRHWASVQVPKLGPVRFRLSRPLPEKYGMARVSLDKAGRWHVSFTAALEPCARTTTGAEVGIDRGVATTLATSDGQMLRIPTRPMLVAKTKRLQEQLSRQHKGSKGRAQTKLQLAKTHAHIVDRRKDWVEKVTTRLVEEYDVVVLEDLVVKNMVRAPRAKPDPENVGGFLPNGAVAKAGLNHSIHAAAWSLFQQRLTDKAQQSGVRVRLVNPAFTSQQCRACGHIAKENRESQAIFRCVQCGHQAHADINAARNILARGTSHAPSPGHGDYARISPPATRSLVAAGTSEMKVA